MWVVVYCSLLKPYSFPSHPATLVSLRLQHPPLLDTQAPAAFCRKGISSTSTFEIWGDGLQTRSFMYIDDCVEGTIRIMMSDVTRPLNLGSTEMVSNQCIGLWCSHFQLLLVVPSSLMNANVSHHPYCGQGHRKLAIPYSLSSTLPCLLCGPYPYA